MLQLDLVPLMVKHFIFLLNCLARVTSDRVGVSSTPSTGFRCRSLVDHTTTGIQAVPEGGGNNVIAQEQKTRTAAAANNVK